MVRAPGADPRLSRGGMSSPPRSLELPSLRQLAWLAPFCALLTAVLLGWHETAREMVSIWWRSGTFTHAFLVPPISAWLIWRKRHDLAALPSRPVSWMPLVAAVACLGWLLGDLAQVGVLTHFALVTVVVVAVPALYGWAVAREIAFPLVFLYFAVPFGDFAVPWMMDWTADFTVLAIRLSGIPIYREDLQFVIPSGTWSVVEACSGVRYLIASTMVGALFAYLNYRSMRRRVAFFALSLVVPVVANWLRAYMIVMIGHLSDNRLAAGVDHLIYGWLFFGVVIGLLFLFGARWAETEPAPAAGAAVPPVRTVEPMPPRSGWTMAAVLGAMVVATTLLSDRLHQPHPLPLGALQLPAPPAGWSASVDPMPWKPAYREAASYASAAVERDGRTLWIWSAYYRDQRKNSKLVTSANSIVATDDTDWVRPAEKPRAPAGGLPAFRTGDLRSGHMLQEANRLKVRLWYAYWVGGRWLISDSQTKAWQALEQLRGRGDDGAVVVLATPSNPDADALLEEFARAALPDLERALAAVRDTR